MASHTASFDSFVQAFFQRLCRRLVGLYVILRETLSALMAVDGSTRIIRNIACVIARGCTPPIGVSDRRAVYTFQDQGSAPGQDAASPVLATAIGSMVSALVSTNWTRPSGKALPAFERSPHPCWAFTGAADDHADSRHATQVRANLPGARSQSASIPHYRRRFLDR